MVRALVLCLIAALMLTTSSCRELGEEGLGQLGEECLTDEDCVEPFSCVNEGVCQVSGPNWPIPGDPLALLYPEGAYVVFDIKVENSNGATRRLNPFIDQSLTQGQSSLVIILREDPVGMPFDLTVGSATGTLPETLRFFDGRLRPRAITGDEYFDEGSFIQFSTLKSPPRTEPEEGFYIVLQGDGFFIPVPIAAAEIFGTTSPPSQGNEGRMDLQIEAFILRSLAQEITVEAEGRSQALDAFLDPVTQDLDINRDTLLDGWTLRLSISALREGPR